MTKHIFLTLISGYIGLANANADFTDYYSFPRNPGATSFLYLASRNGPYTTAANNWSIYSQNTAVYTGVVYPQVSATDSQLIVDSGVPFAMPGHSSLSTLQVLNAAPSAGFLSFDFALSLSAASVNTARSGYYLINGAAFALPQGAGTVSNVFLNAGDTFGFGVSVAEYVSNNYVYANLTVTNFSAPVPEPSGVVLLIFGALAYVASRATRRHLTRL